MKNTDDTYINNSNILGFFIALMIFQLNLLYSAKFKDDCEWLIDRT
jgi:hypothetical protein